MSHTDVHKPYHAKLRDPDWASFRRVFHDHSSGPCDLADFFNDPQAVGVSRGYRCTADLCAYKGHRYRNIHCGCVMCTGHLGARHRRRKLRRLGRQETASWRRGVAVDPAPVKRFPYKW